MRRARRVIQVLLCLLAVTFVVGPLVIWNNYHSAIIDQAISDDHEIVVPVTDHIREFRAGRLSSQWFIARADVIPLSPPKAFATRFRVVRFRLLRPLWRRAFYSDNIGHYDYFLAVENGTGRTHWITKDRQAADFLDFLIWAKARVRSQDDLTEIVAVADRFITTGQYGHSCPGCQVTPTQWKVACLETCNQCFYLLTTDADGLVIKGEYNSNPVR